MAAAQGAQVLSTVDRLSAGAPVLETRMGRLSSTEYVFRTLSPLILDPYLHIQALLFLSVIKRMAALSR